MASMPRRTLEEAIKLAKQVKDDMMNNKSKTIRKHWNSTWSFSLSTSSSESSLEEDIKPQKDKKKKGQGEGTSQKRWGEGNGRGEVIACGNSIETLGGTKSLGGKYPNYHGNTYNWHIPKPSLLCVLQAGGAFTNWLQKHQVNLVPYMLEI